MIKKIIFAGICAISLFGFLSSCSKYVPPKPAPLTSFTETLAVQKIWSNNIGGGISKDNLKLNPAFTNGTIFAADAKGRISAIDKNTGKTLWHVNTKNPITSSLAASDSLVYAGTGSAKILALQQTDGKIKWQKDLVNDVLATPLAVDNMVVTKTESGQLNAFAAENGKLLWKYSQEEPPLILRGSSSPKYADGLVITGFASGEIVALDSDTGLLKWRQTVAEPTGSFPVERMVDIAADPIIYNGVIFAATFQGKLAAINLNNGEVLWKTNASTYEGLAVNKNKVFISDAQDNVIAYDKDTGEKIWEQKSLTNRSLTGPAVIDNAVVVGDMEGYLHFMNVENGNFIARIKVDSSGLLAQPIVKDNALYVITRAGNLVKFAV